MQQHQCRAMHILNASLSEVKADKQVHAFSKGMKRSTCVICLVTGVVDAQCVP